MPGAMTAAAKRGALIVFEGCDKTGKSTHSKLLCQVLQSKGVPATHINFPERTTQIGKMINSYLKCEKDLKDETIHLLFSANRWELVPSIEEWLKEGKTVVVDRYAYSGVAFSSAKGTLDVDWCMRPDVGLPQPDQVLYLDCSSTEASQRGDYGSERYENTEFQKKVKEVFHHLRDDAYWKIVDTSRAKDEVHREILESVLSTIKESETKPILPLWADLKKSST